MLGFVMTDSNAGGSSYKNYGKYGKRYGGYDYGYGYESSSTNSSEKKNQAFLDATSEESVPFSEDNEQ